MEPEPKRARVEQQQLPPPPALRRGDLFGHGANLERYIQELARDRDRVDARGQLFGQMGDHDRAAADAFLVQQMNVYYHLADSMLQRNRAARRELGHIQDSFDTDTDVANPAQPLSASRRAELEERLAALRRGE